MSGKPSIDLRVETASDTEIPVAVPEAATAEQRAGSLEQVREILFGPLSQSLEQRLSRVETRLGQTFASLEETTSQRIDLLERYIKDQLVVLFEKLGQHRDERAMQVQAMKTEVAACIDATERRASEISEQLLEARTEQSADLARQINILMEEIEQRAFAAADDLAKETNTLRDEMVDRAAISSVLGEISRRLSGPGGPASSDDPLAD